MANRDEFLSRTREMLRDRVGNRCSNPCCRIPTSAAASTPGERLNGGRAAHICAAAPGGPRYNPNMTPGERRNIDNGIWLCERCASTIDQDVIVHTVELLNHWKRTAEEQGLKEYQASQLENGSFNIREEIEKAKHFLEFSSALFNDLCYSINQNGRYYPSKDLHVLQHIGLQFGVSGWNTNNRLWSYHPQIRAAQEYIIQLCDGLGREFRHKYSAPRAVWRQHVSVIAYNPDVFVLSDSDLEYLNNIVSLEKALFDTLSRLSEWVHRPW